MKTKLQLYQESITKLERLVPKNRDEERQILLQIQELNLNFANTLPISVEELISQ